MTPTSIALSDFLLSPKAACQLGYDALKANRNDLAESLVLTLKDKMLPHPENNPWDGPAALFWREAFKQDPKVWLEISIGTLSKTEAHASARSLLMESAKGSAFESFEYLLSLGAVKRSWKILEAAFINGGHQAGRKVKNPTPSEAKQMLQPNRSHLRTIDDLMWCASFLKPEVRLNADWIINLGAASGDELAVECIKQHEAFYLFEFKPPILELAASLASLGLEQSALTLLKTQASDLSSALLSHPVENAQVRLAQPPYSPFQVSMQKSSLTLMMSAFIGGSTALVDYLSSKGVPLPTPRDLTALKKKTVNCWRQAIFDKAIDQSLVHLERYELGLIAIASKQEGSRPRL